jgi:hypothetical protein
MDERYAFLGHQLCSPGSDPWIFAPPSPFPAGDSILDWSAWMHPNAAGQGQIKTDLAAYWSPLQAGTAPKIWPQSVNPNPPTGWQSPNLPYGIPTTAQAKTMLAQLTGIPAYNTSTYNVSSFGYPATRNTCDTRNRVLIAEALNTSQNPAQPLLVTSPCTVTAGTWYTPYEATPTQQVCTPTATTCLGTFPGLPIDHLVPTKMAWQSGAWNWANASPAGYGAQGTQMLKDFGNDLGGPQLLVVSTSSNSSKNARGPQDWMPNNTGMYCAYAKMWIAVKWEWNLQVNDTTPGTGVNNPNKDPEAQYLASLLTSNTC